MLRDIIHIDTDKCTGCGACLTTCAENALTIVNGKAVLERDVYCDGLGACLGACPEEALIIIRREAAPFDASLIPQDASSQQHAHDKSCPGNAVSSIPVPLLAAHEPVPAAPTSGLHPSTLRHWPAQLRLMPPEAPFLHGAHLLLAADCAGFAAPNLDSFLANRVLLIACPKLDDLEMQARKLADICRVATPQSITILRMSVPCCGGLQRMAQMALHACGMDIPLCVETVTLVG